MLSREEENVPGKVVKLCEDLKKTKREVLRLQ